MSQPEKKIVFSLVSRTESHGLRNSFQLKPAQKQKPAGFLSEMCRLEDVAISQKGPLGWQGGLLSQPGVLARSDTSWLFDSLGAN